jgi:hypothetical protein
MALLRTKHIGLLTVVAASSAAHAVTIDDFSSGTYSIVASAATPTAEAVRAGSMVGAERDALLTYTSGPLTVAAVVDAGAVQFFHSDTQTEGSLTLQYDGVDGELEDGVLSNGSNLNANLSSDNGFLFDFRFLDAGLGSTLTVETTVQASNGAFTAVSSVPEGLNVQFVQDFSLFGAADFSDVRRIDFTFTGAAGTDFTLDSIRTTSSPIPGPAAGIAFLIGFAGRQRRRN